MTAQVSLTSLILSITCTREGLYDELFLDTDGYPDLLKEKKVSIYTCMRNRHSVRMVEITFFTEHEEHENRSLVAVPQHR